MVVKMPSRVVNTRESAVLAALYIGKQLLSALYVPLPTMNYDDVPSRARKSDLEQENPITCSMSALLMSL